MTSLKARLLKASARMLGTAARHVPVPYELPCECGQRVSGIRRTTGIQAVCSACQTTIYVLPVNVYPSARRVRSELHAGSMAKHVGAVMKDIVDGEPDSESTANPTASHRPDETDRERPEPEDTPESVVQVSKVPFRTRLRRVFSPMRLLAVAGVAVLLGTGSWMAHQQQYESARRIWRQEMDIADTALNDEDLFVLRTALTKAVSAAAVLGRSDAETRRAKSLLEQTVAVEEQSSLDLVEQLSGVFSDDGKLIQSKASGVCAGLSGRRLIFECSLRRMSESVQVLAVDMPLIVDSVPVRIRVQSARLARLAQATPNASVLFSAEIERCEPPDGADGEWRITLAGRSCALFTTELHVAKLGYVPDTTPGLRPLLERQATFVQTDESYDSEELTQQAEAAP